MIFLIHKHPDGQRIEFDASQQKLIAYDDEGGSIPIGIGFAGLYEMANILEALAVAMEHSLEAQE